jgi:hypothetical protein
MGSTGINLVSWLASVFLGNDSVCSHLKDVIFPLVASILCLLHDFHLVY